MDKRNEIVRFGTNKAFEELKNSKLSLENELFNSSISASYYVIFHSARALLAAEGIITQKHSGVIHLFAEHFIKSGIVDKSFSKVISSAFKLRNESDYADLYFVDKTDAVNQYNSAMSFIRMSLSVLRNKCSLDYSSIFFFP